MEEPKFLKYEGIDYHKFWEGKKKEYIHTVEKKALQNLIPGNKKWFIDIGTGYGRLSHLYLEKYDNVVVSDYALSMMKEAKENIEKLGFSNVIYIAANAYKLPFGDSVFDDCMMIRVLHHLQKPKACLHEINRILRPRGHFIFNYPNKRRITEIARFLLGKQNQKPFDKTSFQSSELTYVFHPAFIEDCLDRTGFEIIKQVGLGNLGLESLLRLVKKPAELESVIQGFAGYLKLSPLMLILSQSSKEDSRRVSVTSLEDILKCPKCQRDILQKESDSFVCVKCGKIFKKEDGIYDFRIE